MKFDSRYFMIDAAIQLVDPAGLRAEPAGLDSLSTAGKCPGQGGPAAPTIPKAGNSLGARRTARSILRFLPATTAESNSPGIRRFIKMGRHLHLN